MLYFLMCMYFDRVMNKYVETKPKAVEEKLQCGADNAKDWSRQNNMLNNYDKTNYMILGITNNINRMYLKSLILE